MEDVTARPNMPQILAVLAVLVAFAVLAVLTDSRLTAMRCTQGWKMRRTGE